MLFDKFSVSELSTLGRSIEQDAESLSHRNFNAIGLVRQKVHEYGLEKTGELIDEFQLKVSSLAWAGGFTGDSRAGVAYHLDDTFQAIDEAAHLGADCLIVHLGSRNGHTDKHVRRIAKKSFAKVVEVAQSKNVKIAIEPAHPLAGKDRCFIHELEEAIEFVAPFGELAGIVYDTYHLGFEDENIDLINKIAPHVALVQLADAVNEPTAEQDRCIPGEGTLPLRTIVEAFCRAGYNGFFEYEVFGRSVELYDYESIVEKCRESMNAFKKLAIQEKFVKSTRSPFGQSSKIQARS